jgi:hypothetical protein
MVATLARPSTTHAHRDEAGAASDAALPTTSLALPSPAVSPRDRAFELLLGLKEIIVSDLADDPETRADLALQLDYVHDLVNAADPRRVYEQRYAQRGTLTDGQVKEGARQAAGAIVAAMKAGLPIYKQDGPQAYEQHMVAAFSSVAADIQERWPGDADEIIDRAGGILVTVGEYVEAASGRAG